MVLTDTDAIKDAERFLEGARRIDLDKVRAELARLRTVDFKNPLKARAPYTPAYRSSAMKDADTPLKCVAALVKEWTTAIDQYNTYNKDKGFMTAFLETPDLGAGKAVRGDRAELIYDAGQVLMAYRHDLQSFLKDLGLWDDLRKVEPKERSIFCRVIPRKTEWWITY